MKNILKLFAISFVFIFGISIGALAADTTPPAAFTPTLNVTSPTTTTRPILLFSTTDDSLDHYEVKIDNGPFTLQFSPYTLPVLGQGDHTFTVRAYDTTGNYTNGSISLTVNIITPTPYTWFHTGSYNANAHGVALSGSLAYLAANGLKIVNVSNPSSPTLTGSLTFSSSPFEPHPYSIVVSGNRAYIGDYNYGFRIVDISNPASPTLVSQLSIDPYNSGKLAVFGNYAYLTTAFGLRIIDISNETSPALAALYVNTINTTGNVSDVAISGIYAYIAVPIDAYSIASGLEIVDISSPATPVHVVNYLAPSTMGIVQKVLIQNNYVYLVGEFGFQIINISTPSSPVLVGSYISSDNLNLQSIALSGNFAYIAGGKGLRVFDISNLSSPSLLASYDNTGENGEKDDIAVSGDYVYIANTSGLQIYRVDLTTPSLPMITITSPNNSSMPSITFSSTDNIGISSYQVKIDSGDFSAQTSPYTLPSLTEGAHTITVRAYDAAGNYTDGTATVVIDLTTPVITLNGESKVILPIGSTYTDAGATATDNVDGNIASSSIVKTGTVNTAKEGSYFIKYNVTDAAGNAAVEVKRHIVIKPVAAILKDLNKSIKADSKVVEKVKGGILLQVQGRGEMWYVNPKDGRKYSLGKAADAFAIIKKLGIGISNADMAKIPRNGTKDKGDQVMMDKLKGKILIQVQGKGQAWYVHSVTGKRYLLGTPTEAFKTMTKLGKGIINANLNKVPTGVVVR